MKQHIGIIGGGIIGLCCAYYLQKSGYQVTLFDSGEIGKGASYGNAGWIVPALYQPLSSPDIRAKGIKWLLNPNSPFYLKPRLDRDLLKWLWLFNRFCTAKHATMGKPLLRDWQLYSLSLFKEMQTDVETTCEQTGVCFIARTEKGLQELEILAAEAKTLDLSAELLTATAINTRETGLSLNCQGGLYYPTDSKVHPYTLVQHLHSYLIAQGVHFHTHCAIKTLHLSSGSVQSMTDSRGNVHHCDQYIIAGGAYSDELGKMLGVNLPIQAGKGFSFVTAKTPTLDFKTPLMLLEDKIAVTPYANHVRFAGTMMFCGKDLSINQYRVENMRVVANRLFTNVALTTANTDDIWAGLRPCSPDGIPLVGRTNPVSNVIVATGHGMLGISLGAATGKIVSDLVDEQRPEIDIHAMRLQRF